MLRKELKKNHQINKETISNYIIRICSALFMSAGILYGLYTAEGAYETVVFILFFGLFLGSMLGVVLGYILSGLFLLIFKIISVFKSAEDRKS